MFEDLIAQLDSIGVEYIEDYDTGTLTIDVSTMDKVTLINVINIVTSFNLPFTVDESTLVVTGMGEVEPMEEEEDTVDMDAAMNQALGL
jgi:hypothetical protein